MYSVNQKQTLNDVLLDGQLELANNLAERVINQSVNYGQKNWLFYDTDKGADASTRCYSIIESAKLNDFNIFGYLTHLLTKLTKVGTVPTSEQFDALIA